MLQEMISTPLTNDRPLKKLLAHVSGAVYVPGDAHYDKARMAWNLTVDQYPAVIVVAHSVNDVVEAVNAADDAGLKVAVQSTGHGIARKADGALLIITSQMKGVGINPARQTAWIAAGSLWREVLAESQVYGLAPLLGSSPEVGVMGYTLGGGMGWLARKYGLATDSVISFDVVTSDGRALRASRNENSDLFWGLRGGGGSLAVVTGMEIQLYPVATVYGGNLMYPAEMARDIFVRYREWVADAPDELTSAVALMNFPSVPSVPEFLRGRSVAIVRGCYCGDVDEGQALIESWLKWRAPIANTWQAMPFTQVGSISDDPEDPMPSVHSGAWMCDLNDAAIDVLVSRTFTSDVMPPLVYSEVRHTGGAISRVKANDSPIGHRDAPFVLGAVGMAPTPEAHHQVTGYVAQMKAELANSLNGVYMNFLEGDETRQQTRDAYSAGAYRQLMALKSKYDQHDLFSHSFSIKPQHAG